MIHLPCVLALLGSTVRPIDVHSGRDEAEGRVFQVRQVTTLERLSADSGAVRWWIAIPGDDRFQDVLDLSVVSAPGPWRIIRDDERGNRFLLIEARADGERALSAVIEYRVRRSAVTIEVDPESVEELSDASRQALARELRRDEPHMEVTAEIQELADRVCGGESNPAREARLLLEHVAATADHYSADPTLPHDGPGDARDCLRNGGGSCTDMHSLFIALARARGIPARLQMGYRLPAASEGRSLDPGYRCWVEYFLTGYGWVPADIVDADAAGDPGAKRWFAGLNERRVWLHEGRGLALAADAVAPRVDTLRVGYADLDGRESPGAIVRRTVEFSSEPDAGPAEPALPSFRAEFIAMAEEYERFDQRALDRVRSLALDTAAPVRRRINALGEYTDLLLRFGEVDEALVRIDEAIRLADAEESLRGRTSRLWSERGLAYLRKAEIENCIRRKNAQCCIFPLREGGQHAQREPAREALRSYRIALGMRPDDLAAMWLLNICAMALGEHPAGVDERWLLPPASFESGADIGRFRDVAQEAGVDAFDLAGAAMIEDFDGDGLLDVVSSTLDPAGPMHFYRGGPGMTFEDRTAAARLDDQLGGLDCVAADYDSDGDADILVLRGGWLMERGRMRNSLLRNEGRGVFVDVTREAGLALPAMPTQAACWGDFDSDGDLDLYVGNESGVEVGRPEHDFPSQLFLNRGDGTFVDVAVAAGVTNDRYAKGVACGDYDNDGDLDLYVSNLGRNRLYRNEGGARFVDVAPELGVTKPGGRSFATWFFDYDNDGWLDIFVAGYHATIIDLTLDRLGRPHGGTISRLYRNAGGTFEDVTERVGLVHPYLPMGANFGDLDNDGWLDLYLGTGEPSYQALMPNVALRNAGGARFDDVTTSSGMGHLQKGHGVAFGDLDEDGDQDLYSQLGGFFPGDKFHNALFENPGHGNRFLHVKLAGTRSNRAAYGARVRVIVEEDGAQRTIHRAVGSVSSFGGSPSRQEIGLGRAERIVALEVTWPLTGEVQRFTDVPLDARIEIVEGRAAWRSL